MSLDRQRVQAEGCVQRDGYLLYIQILLSTPDCTNHTQKASKAQRMLIRLRRYHSPSVRVQPAQVVAPSPRQSSVVRVRAAGEFEQST